MNKIATHADYYWLLTFFGTIIWVLYEVYDAY